MASNKRIRNSKDARAHHHTPVKVNEHRFRNSGVTDRSDRQLVHINGYDAVTEIACDQVGMAYGKVYVGGCADSRRSHEINEHGDGRGFIPREQLKDEREQKRVYMADYFIAPDD